MATELADNDGVTLAWERRDPRDETPGAGDHGTPLVLVHGLGYARWGWEPVVDRLVARRPVVLFDNRGIGDSDVPPGPYTAAQMAGDVVAVMDAAGVERAHVLGASLGGMVAQELALAHPDRVDHLVLCATTPGGSIAYPLPEATADLIAAMPEMEPAAALRAAVENALGEVDGAPRRRLVERIVAHRLTTPQDPAGWQAQAHAGTTFDAGERVTAVAQPTLVVHGTADAVVDVRNAQVLAGLLPHAHVELVAGAGHLCFWEDPAGFVALVDGFLPG